MNTLDQLRVGDRATIVDISGQDGIAIRLLEMGLTEGEEIEVIGFAPLGDPIEFQVRGYRLSLRARSSPPAGRTAGLVNRSMSAA